MDQLNEQTILTFIKTAICKKNMTLKKLKPEEKNIILGIASLSIPMDTEFSELDINAQLLSWLNTEGEMLKIDYIELRRTLIDFQFWIRDKSGTTYIRKELDDIHEAKTIMNSLNAIDIHQFIQEVKNQYAIETIERKLQFQSKKSI